MITILPCEAVGRVLMRILGDPRMDSRRQSSPQNEGTLLRVWGLCVVTCLAAVSTANAQFYAPMTGGGLPGSVYGDPNASTLYSPQGPQAAFGPGDGYQAGMMGQDIGMLSQNGMAQPGEMQSLNYSQSLGDYGNVQMYGDPNGEGGIGANYHANPATWAHVRDLQLGVYTNENQTVINGGSTFEFYVDDNFGFGGRALLGGTNNDLITDEFHFSGDLYVGTTRLNQHWIKGGVIYDTQTNFHKVGPAVGFLMFADRRHPINLDFAYGIGYGDPVIDRVNSTITTVADDDAQLRVGTYLTPNLQAGFSGNWVNFPTDDFQDYNGYGGFINLNLGTLSVNVDYTTGDHRDRGFVNVAYTFGGRRSRAADGCDMAFVEHPRDWLGKPVMRDVSLQLQTARVALPPLPQPPPPSMGVGNLSQINCILATPRPAQQIDVNGNGVIDPGDTFELDFQFVNNTANTAFNVSFGNSAVVIGNGTLVGAVGETVGNVPPFTTITSDPNSGDACVLVNPTAQPGNQIFIEFEVIADGVTRRFRCGPIIVGQSRFDGSISPLVPVN